MSTNLRNFDDTLLRRSSTDKTLVDFLKNVPLSSRVGAAFWQISLSRTGLSRYPGLFMGWKKHDWTAPGKCRNIPYRYDSRIDADQREADGGDGGGYEYDFGLNPLIYGLLGGGVTYKYTHKDYWSVYGYYRVTPPHLKIWTNRFVFSYDALKILRKIFDIGKSISDSYFRWIVIHTNEKKGYFNVDELQIPYMNFSYSGNFEWTYLRNLRHKEDLIIVNLDMNLIDSPLSTSDKKKMTRIYKALHRLYFSVEWINHPDEVEIDDEGVYKYLYPTDYLTHAIPLGMTRQYRHNEGQSERSDSKVFHYMLLVYIRPHKGNWYPAYVNVILDHMVECDKDYARLGGRDVKKSDHVFFYIDIDVSAWGKPDYGSWSVEGDRKNWYEVVIRQPYVGFHSQKWSESSTFRAGLDKYVLSNFVFGYLHDDQNFWVDGKSSNGLTTQDKNLDPTENIEDSFAFIGKYDTKRALTRLSPDSILHYVAIFNWNREKYPFTLEILKEKVRPRTIKIYSQYNPKDINYALMMKVNRESSRRSLGIVPDFIWKKVNPKTVGNTLHTYFKSLPTESGSKKKISLEEYKKKLHQTFKEIKDGLFSSPVAFDLVGTDFIAVGSYSSSSKEWTFELLVKSPQNVFTASNRKKYVFANNVVEDDIDVAINSSLELVAYGQSIPIKDRFMLDGEIDLNLHIEPIHDEKQSPSLWYTVSMKTDQSEFETQLEVPKDQVVTNATSIVDRHHLAQTYLMKNADRYYEKTNYELDKKKFYEDVDLEKRRIQFEHGSKQWEMGMGMATNLISGGLMMAANPVAGLASIAGTVAGGIHRWQYEEQKYRFQNEEQQMRITQANRSFSLKDESLMNRHKHAEKLQELDLQRLNMNYSYPQTNNSLIYKELNKMKGRTNVYLVRYTLEGDLLAKVKEHYSKYGYDLVLADQVCRGIKDIKNVIKFQHIEVNRHPNSTIRAMIEQVLLSGVRIRDYV